MKIYNSVDEYLKNAKVNDIIVLNGSGIVCGLNVEFKNETYKVCEVQDNDFTFKRYKSKKRLKTRIHNQKVGVLTKEKFNQLNSF